MCHVVNLYFIKIENIYDNLITMNIGYITKATVTNAFLKASSRKIRQLAHRK